jgi:hypothetical protein
MPRGTLEISPEAETQTSPAMRPHLFIDQYAGLVAEHSVQNYALKARPRRLPSRFALAIASGVIVALAFVYFLG